MDKILKNKFWKINFEKIYNNKKYHLVIIL